MKGMARRTRGSSLVLSGLMVSGLVFGAMMAGTARADASSVNCNQGDSLSAALAAAAPGDVVTVQGTCLENPAITTDGVTLDGGGTATINGGFGSALTVDGAQRVVVTGVRLRGSTFGLAVRGNAAVSLVDSRLLENVFGIDISGGSALSLTGVVVRDTIVTGINGSRSAAIDVTGELRVVGSGVFGINLSDNSSLFFRQADVGVHENVLGVQISIGSSAQIADADTVVNTSRNLSTGFTVNTGSTLFLFEGSLISNSNQFNHGLSVSSNANVDLDRQASITARNNGQDGVRLETSTLNLFTMANLAGPQVVTTGNGRHGVNAELESTVDLSFSAELISRNNGDAGLRADNGSAVGVVNSRVTGNPRDVVLSFGSRGDLQTSVIGTLECDGTSLIRGDTGLSCPSP